MLPTISPPVERPWTILAETKRTVAAGPILYAPTELVGRQAMKSALKPMATTLICREIVRANLSPIRPRTKPPRGRAKKAAAKTP